jgi:hypothetical protein
VETALGLTVKIAALLNIGETGQRSFGARNHRVSANGLVNVSRSKP